MKWIDCGLLELEAIRSIFNEVIATSTALYEDDPRSPEFMTAWLEAKQKAGYPVLGVTDDGGTLMGFASYGAFRPHPGYRHTVEHSVYVAQPFQGRGIGKLLLQRITQAARDNGFRTLIGVIDADNDASISLHEKQGFTRCAEIREAGFKFGRWLDIVMYQKLLTGD